jgi:hypothetical protein
MESWIYMLPSACLEMWSLKSCFHPNIGYISQDGSQWGKRWRRFGTGTGEIRGMYAMLGMHVVIMPTG